MINIVRLQVIITFAKSLSLLIYQSRHEVSELLLRLKALFSICCTKITNCLREDFNGIYTPNTATCNFS